MTHYDQYAQYAHLEAIHDSLLNGQRRQMVTGIDDYGPMDFWPDYTVFLGETFDNDPATEYHYFKDAVISYHRIKDRLHD